MSEVLLAADLSLDRRVGVKVLPAELSAAASADRFRREIQLIGKLQHPHVVPIHSAGDADGTPYYVMPFLTGETLRTRIAREGPSRCPMPCASFARRSMRSPSRTRTTTGVVAVIGWSDDAWRQWRAAGNP